MDVDVVIIGLQSEKTLARCIQSILLSQYSFGKVHIYYVDGGSTDQSMAIAKRFSEVTVLDLDNRSPTPGLGRNIGWQKGSSPLVQFVDSDTVLDPLWLQKGSFHLKEQPHVVGVFGYLQELFPDKNFYHFVASQEWNSKGEHCSFGGLVLLRREVLEKEGGYNPDLIAGEDPELSLRIALSGGKCQYLHLLMAYHELDNSSFFGYFKRAFRSGYGFASVVALHFGKSTFWQRELARILIRGGCIFVFFFLTLFLSLLYAVPLCFFLFYPFFRFKQHRKNKQLSKKDAFYYLLHCSFVVIPQFFGAMRYFLGSVIGYPLTNNSLRTR